MYMYTLYLEFGRVSFTLVLIRFVQLVLGQNDHFAVWGPLGW